MEIIWSADNRIIGNFDPYDGATSAMPRTRITYLIDILQRPEFDER
jgi:hypothetical protein